MTTGTITCRPDDDLGEVLQRVRPQPQVLVTDEQERLIGIVSFEETARRLAEREIEPASRQPEGPPIFWSPY